MREHNTKGLKGLIQKHRELLVKFCHRFPKLYNLAYLLSVFAFIIFFAFIDISAKAIVYPVFYEMEETSGVIEESSKTKVNVSVKRRTHSFSWYYYTVDGLQIPVNASQLRNYDEGDVMPYYRYERNGKVAGEIIEFTLLKGILIFAADVLVIINVWLFVSTETDSSEILRRKKRESIKPPEKVDYNTLSASELYKLCLQRKIPKVHTKKKDTAYLKNCLRQKDAEESRRYERTQQKGSSGLSVFLMVIVVVAIGVTLVSFAVAARGILITMM